ncbi:hypothetical protein O181_005954 [Austropuccinia psidii MF-1]|uniref:Peptidase A2 domain-containing protein n=1 Tax=Austropuccinia psidii MF-1 TaxID=1389203 RepID=A0A9Q3GGD6_9BASI|nr:hypothetical protein [Austropuccinia psidii MF-1]
MIELSVGQEGHKVKALVDTGAELNIVPEVEYIKEGLPMRVLKMRIRGIGLQSTEISGLSESTVLVLPSGDDRKIHFFLARGAVYQVIRRSFLASNGIRLESLNKKVKLSAIKSVMEEDCVYTYVHQNQNNGAQDHPEEWKCVKWLE